MNLPRGMTLAVVVTGEKTRGPAEQFPQSLTAETPGRCHDRAFFVMGASHELAQQASLRL